MIPRDSWMRTGVAVVVGLKLVGLLPFHSVAGSGSARDAVEAAKPTADTAAPAVAPDALPVGDEQHETRGAPLRIPGDGSSAEFATENRGVRTLVEALRRRAEELETRDAELGRREEAVAGAAQDLDTKIRHLETLAAQVRPADTTAAVGAGEAATPAATVSPSASMEELGKIYGGMKAEEAAPLFNRLDDEIVYQIFRHMKQRQISAVLPLMEPDKAVVLTEFLGGRKRRTPPIR